MVDNKFVLLLANIASLSNEQTTQIMSSVVLGIFLSQYHVPKYQVHWLFLHEMQLAVAWFVTDIIRSIVVQLSGIVKTTPFVFPSAFSTRGGCTPCAEREFVYRKLIGIQDRVLIHVSNLPREGNSKLASIKNRRIQQTRMIFNKNIRLRLLQCNENLFCVELILD